MPHKRKRRFASSPVLLVCKQRMYLVSFREAISSNHSTALAQRRRLVSQACSNILLFPVALCCSKWYFEGCRVPSPGWTCLEVIFLFDFGFGAQNLPSVTWDLAMAGDGAGHLQDLGFGTDPLHSAMRAARMLLLLTSSAIPCWVPFCKICSSHGPGAFPLRGREEGDNNVL